MRNAFSALDSNGNGKLQETELRHILRNLGDMLSGEEIDDIVSELKTDHNGFVVCSIRLTRRTTTSSVTCWSMATP